ncbi:hypothetical protein LSUE1_G004710 [Lachnellula suecica]|uniref:Uncharacterized protein n=1 Tax=Lachnellula suecica TaxID=602035 RepID=A0A8T9CEN4_9HELO|nr:hypothetical protein LSUE1_G004710 [Lachnellula suecica]
MGSALKAAAVAAITLSSNQLSVFQIDSSNALRHKSLSGSSWSSGWDNLGGRFSSPPAVTSWGSNNMHCMGVGTDKGAWGKN